jgi:hypothetical protein
VKGNKEEMLQFMKQIGPNAKPTAEDYRTWPVFRGMRTDDDFMETFETVFGEPLIAPSRLELPAAKSLDSEPGEESDLAIEDAPKPITRH